MINCTTVCTSTCYILKYIIHIVQENIEKYSNTCIIKVSTYIFEEGPNIHNLGAGRIEWFLDSDKKFLNNKKGFIL